MTEPDGGPLTSASLPLGARIRLRGISPPGAVSGGGEERRLAALVFAVLLGCYVYFPPRWADWNQNSRLDLTLAIVEQGTLRIDDYYENTGDYAVYGGHVYTDKAPGVSLLGVPVYFVFHRLADTAPVRALLRRASAGAALARTLREGGTGLREDKIRFAAALYAVSVAVVSVPSALLGAALYVFLGRLVADAGLRVALALAYGLATIAFAYSTVLYGHQSAAALLFFAFALLHRVRRGEGGPGALWGAGALLGLAVLTDFPALVPAAILFLYGFRFLARKADAMKVVLGALPFALLLGWYNAAAFGSPLSSSYRHLGRFQEISSTGVLGFGRPSLAALWGITFSPRRGLFYLSPFLLLAIPGLHRLLRGARWRAEALVWLAALLAQLVLVSAWYDWYGGFAIGPRNLLIVLPFLVPPVAVAVDAWRAERALRFVCGASFALSFVLVWIVTVSGQEFAPVQIANPLADFFWPKLRGGDVARNLGMAAGLPAWWSLLPPLLLVAGTLWVARSGRLRAEGPRGGRTAAA
jgi:hypothetical protein